MVGHVGDDSNRMDGCDLESGNGLHEAYPRLRLLLRGAVLRAFSGRARPSVRNGFDLTLKPERLTQPLTWRKPKRIFVNSMSDLFHKEVPRPFIDAVFQTMERADWHTFQVLTKRSSLLARYLRGRYGDGLAPPHIWLGVSIEDEKNAVRLKHLHAAQASVKFVSFEPLLGPVGKVHLKGIDWVSRTPLLHPLSCGSAMIFGIHHAARYRGVGRKPTGHREPHNGHCDSARGINCVFASERRMPRLSGPATPRPAERTCSLPMISVLCGDACSVQCSVQCGRLHALA
jgi:protein gp37